MIWIIITPKLPTGVWQQQLDVFSPFVIWVGVICLWHNRAELQKGIPQVLNCLQHLCGRDSAATGLCFPHCHGARQLAGPQGARLMPPPPGTAQKRFSKGGCIHVKYIFCKGFSCSILIAAPGRKH